MNKINKNNILEIMAKDNYEFYLKDKKQQERSIEQLLLETPMDLDKIIREIELLCTKIRVVEYFKLISEGKSSVSRDFFTDLSIQENIINDLFEKYNISMRYIYKKD